MNVRSCCTLTLLSCTSAQRYGANYLKENQNASRPSKHTPVRGKNVIVCLLKMSKMYSAVHGALGITACMDH